MPRVERKTPEQFVARSPIGERLSRVFNRNLAGGALRLVELNKQPRQHEDLDTKEAKIGGVLKSGYFGIINKNPEFVDAEINGLLIDKDDVPQSYYDLQRRIARERGYGDKEFSDEQRAEMVEMLRDDQVESLEEWAGYLRSNENGHIYPDWFKVYVWESLKKMGEFDKERGKFKKRTKSTTAPWPELNVKALAYVWDKIDHSVIKGGAVDDEKLANLLDGGNFAELYAHALHEAEAGIITPELREITKGSWVKYDQIQGSYHPNYQNKNGEYTDDAPVDNDTAMGLAQSLRKWNTGWPTAGTHTAAHQLSMGDLYVYYTQNKKGQDTVPRIVIRMEDGVVAETCGIESDQSLESNMIDIVAEKLETLPGGDKYFKKIESIKRLAEIYERAKDSGELTTDDIAFLYLDKAIRDADVIVGDFDWYTDPRVEELFEGRDFGSDMQKLLDEGNVSPDDLVDQLIDNAYAAEVADSVGLFTTAGVDPMSLMDKLFKKDMGWEDVARNIGEFVDAGVGVKEAVNKFKDSKFYKVVVDHLEGFVGAGLDPTELANDLLAKDKIGLVAEKSERFVNAGMKLDSARVTQATLDYIEAGGLAHVALTPTAFLRLGVDPNKLVNELLARGRAHDVVDLLGEYRGAEIDLVDLVNKVIKSGKADYVSANLEQLVEAGLNRDWLLEKIKADQSKH